MEDRIALAKYKSKLRLKNRNKIKVMALECAEAVDAVYKGAGENVRSTEWNFYKKEDYQVLAIGGTNEWIDWVLNFILFSCKGVKFHAWFSAKRIYKYLLKNGFDPKLDLFITCHSKSCTTGFTIKQFFIPDAFCIAFCPAPGFKKAPVMNDGKTLAYIDPDDLVPLAGGITFDNPVCDTELLPRDCGFFNFKDRIANHSMKHIIEYLNEAKV